MNTQETATLLYVLRSVWPNTEITANTVKAYQWALEDLTMEDGERAAKTWMRTGKFFPKPAELREIVGRAAVDSDQIAETAWVEVMAQIRRCGATKTRTFSGNQWRESPDPEFSTDLIRRVVESIGWRNLCLEPQSKMRTDFIFAYRNLFNAAVSTIQRGDIDTTTTLPANVSTLKEIAS